MEKLFDKLFNEQVRKDSVISAYARLVPQLLKGSNDKPQFMRDCHQNAYKKLKKDYKSLKKITKINLKLLEQSLSKVQI